MSLAVSGKQFPGSIQMRVLANTGENIENLSPVRPGVLHTVRGQDRQSIMRGKIDKLLIDAFLSAKEMSLNFHEHILAPESIDQKPSANRGVLGSTGCQPVASGSLPDAGFVGARGIKRSLRQAAANSRLAACAPQSQKRDKSSRKLRQLFPSHCALSFLTPQMRLGQ